LGVILIGIAVYIQISSNEFWFAFWPGILGFGLLLFNKAEETIEKRRDNK